MGMAAILFDGAEPFEQTGKLHLTEGLMWNMVQIAQAFSEKTFKNYTVLYMYIVQGQGQITPVDKILIITKMFYYFNHSLYVSAISL